MVVKKQEGTGGEPKSRQVSMGVVETDRVFSGAAACEADASGRRVLLERSCD